MRFLDREEAGIYLARALAPHAAPDGVVLAPGTLVLSPDGRFIISHVTPRMAAGWWDGKGKPVVKDRF